MSPFPPAFSICVMFGVLATFATFLSTRTWFTRIVSISFLLVLVAASGLLDYDVEIRDLHSWYPSALAQLRRRVSPDPATPPSYSRVTNLESFQRNIPPQAAALAWREREALLDRWASSFPRPDGAAAGADQADPGRGRGQRRCAPRGHLDRDRARLARPDIRRLSPSRPPDHRRLGGNARRRALRLRPRRGNRRAGRARPADCPRPTI